MRHFDDNVEQVVLGTMVVYPETVGAIIKTLLPDVFFVEANRAIFKIFQSLYLKNLAIDYAALATETIRYNETQSPAKKINIGYLSSLGNFATQPSNLDFQLQILNECLKVRQLKNVVDDIQKKLTESATEDIKATLTEVSEKVQKINALSKETACFLLDDEIEIFKDHLLDKPQGIETGFPKIDEMTCGLQPGELIIIGARPSIGKSAFALALLLNIAVRKEIPVAFISLEMDRKSIIRRLVQAMSIDNGEDRLSISRAMKKHDFTYPNGTLKPDYQKVKDSLERLKGLKIYSVDTPNALLSDIVINARNFVKEHGVQVIFIDYIGLIKSGLNDNMPNYEKVGYISRQLKQLARDLQIPVVCLAQLNRDSENNKPTLANLRDSGSIEQDADVIMFLHGPRYEVSIDSQGQQTYKRFLSRVVAVEKNRNGDVGEIKFEFDRDAQRFKELA